MSAIDCKRSLADVLLDSYVVLEGEDSYSMGDPGGLGTTGDARQALWNLLREHGLDPDEGEMSERYRRHDRAFAPIEEEDERLRALDRVAQARHWLKALAALENASRPLTELAPFASQLLVEQAYSLLNTLGHRNNTLSEIARNNILAAWLRDIAIEVGERAEARVLSRYATDLELNTRRDVLGNDLAIDVEPGSYYEYTGSDEWRSGMKLLAADFELPDETEQSDWRLIEGQL